MRAAVVAGVVLATPAPARAEDTVVAIHGYRYHAADAAVQLGDAVTWTNEDTARHDVATTAGPEAFQSPELAQGESFTYTFSQVGVYAYLCTLHPDMVGSLTVTPAPVTSVAPAPVAPGPVEAVPTTATTSAPAAVAGGEAVAQVAAVSDPDLSEASRPYVELLAVVAAVVVAVGLLFGARGRRRAEHT